MRRSLLNAFIPLLLVPPLASSAAAEGREVRSAHDVEQALAGLLAADRNYAALAARTDAVSGLTAMFDDEVLMIAPGIGFARGKAAARSALAANPVNLSARAEWTPIRAGLSADGRHGFTAGYILLRRSDGDDLPGKYLAYWVRGADGWRVRAYKRSPRPPGSVSTALLPAVVPPRLVRSRQSEPRLAGYRSSLDRAERDFSDEAQRIGLGPAFARNGSPDAINMGGGPDFVLGADAIARAVGGGEGGPSPVTWKPDEVIVAASGDLGVTLGYIRRAQTEGKGIPFFTVWRRAGPDAPWHYVAE